MPEKKTWITEASSFIAAGALVYVSYSNGAVNPSALGEASLHLFEILSMAIPAFIMCVRVAYKAGKAKVIRHANKI